MGRKLVLLYSSMKAESRNGKDSAGATVIPQSEHCLSQEYSNEAIQRSWWHLTKRHQLFLHREQLRGNALEAMTSK